MARKRKLESRSSNEPAKKQQQQQQEQEQEQEQKQEQEQQKVVEEEEEYEEVEEEVEEDEEEEDEDGKGEEGGDAEEEEAETANHDNPTATDGSGGGGDDGDDDDDDEEPIEKLLEPFGRDQLANILREAAEKHRDVADRIRMVADEDPVHRKIFVHGLGWDTNAETLTSVFKEYGPIEDCKAVCDKVSGKSKGYGFILFKTRSAARKALKQPQKRIGNRVTACQLASVGPVPAASAVPTQQPQAPSSEYTLRKIYVSNVGAELDPQKLVVFFSKYGEIEEGPLGLDKSTGRPKGFCLFVYKTVDGARKALAEPHKNFEGHILHCQKAVDGPKPGKSHHRNQQHHYNQRNGNPGYVGGAASGPTGPGHLVAPSGPGIGFNQGAAAAQALNPALGQAITTLLATQGSGLGLTNLLGTLGSTAGMAAPGVGGTGHGIQGGYGNQAGVSPGVMGGGYGNQGGMQGGYSNQQMMQGGTGRGQGGVGQYGGAPTYMGH